LPETTRITIALIVHRQRRQEEVAGASVAADAFGRIQVRRAREPQEIRGFRFRERTIRAEAIADHDEGPRPHANLGRTGQERELARRASGSVEPQDHGRAALEPAGLLARRGRRLGGNGNDE
jgi:hypothetical protein